jgi:hypothetical protein
MDLISIAQETEEVDQDAYEDRLQGGAPIPAPTLEGLKNEAKAAGKKPTHHDLPASEMGKKIKSPETVYNASGQKASNRFSYSKAKKPIPADTLSSVVDGLKAVRPFRFLLLYVRVRAHACVCANVC